MRDGCPFCDYAGPSPLLFDGRVIVFEPLDPVTEGHLLVVPREHVVGFENPLVVSDVMATVALIVGARSGFNVIVSVGAEATQTVPHLHAHVVPRRRGDGLVLPWGKRAEEHEPKQQPSDRPAPGIS